MMKKAIPGISCVLQSKDNEEIFFSWSFLFHHRRTREISCTFLCYLVALESTNPGSVETCSLWSFPGICCWSFVPLEITQFTRRSGIRSYILFSNCCNLWNVVECEWEEHQRLSLDVAPLHSIHLIGILFNLQPKESGVTVRISSIFHSRHFLNLQPRAIKENRSIKGSPHDVRMKRKRLGGNGRKGKTSPTFTSFTLELHCDLLEDRKLLWKVNYIIFLVYLSFN